MIWKILGIEKTKDEEAIKTAYRSKLRYVNPEDDEEGFKELRRAYEEALEYASQEETESLHNTDDGTAQTGKKDEVDLWIDRIDAIYRDVALRRDESKWEKLLHDPVCDDLDTELEAAEKLLVYFMSHTFMPQNIWKLVDKRFQYMDNFDQYKERFPEHYLEYVKWQIESPSFIDYELFDGKTDDNVDEFISKLFEIRSLSEERDLKKIRQLLKELERFELTHPFAAVEQARYFLLMAQQLETEERAAGEEVKQQADRKENSSKEGEPRKLRENALEMMEEIEFEYSDNPYVERTYAEVLIANGQIEKAHAIYNAMVEKDAENYTAKLGQANCVFLEGNPEEAKEQVEDLMEERVQDMDCLALMDQMNEVLVKEYEQKLEEGFDRETCFKLGWCYYQQKEFKKGIALIDTVEDSEDYDYVNLRCRLYLAAEDYEKAYPLARKWLQLIEESEDDGSREMAKRKNRLSLAHFAMGVCIWETDYKHAEENRKDSVFEEGVRYLKKAVEEENNVFVKLSYMEQMARFYLEAKDYEGCIEICNEIIEQDRGYFPAYVHRQKANYELKNAKEVIDDYYICQDIYAAYAPPYILAAEVFFAFEQYDDVEQIIEAAAEAEINSDSLELYRIKCIHYKEFSAENVQRALEAVLALKDRLAKMSADEETDIEDLADVERELAVIYWDQDKIEETMSVIDGYLKQHPDDLTMLHLKADVLNREDQPEEALKVCQRLVDMEPDNPYTAMKIGNCWERLSKLNRAVDCYERILQGRAEFAPALRRLMYIYSFVSNRDDDLEKCRVAIDYASRFIEVTGSAEGYVERGNLYIDLYELEKAVKDCEKAVELDEEAYYAYNNMGCALLKLRRIDEAIKPLKRAIELDADRDHLPYLNLAECYVLQKNYDEAIKCYKKALRLRPEVVRWKEEIAKIYALKGDFSHAVNIYQQMIDGIMKDVSRMNLVDKMKFYLGSALTLENKRLYELYGNIAEVYHRAGDTEKAIEYYKKSMGLKSFFMKDYPLEAVTKAAEFYRDIGNCRYAEWMLDQAMKPYIGTDRDLGAQKDAYFAYMTIYFESGIEKEAQQYADAYMKELLSGYQDEEDFLSDLRYRPSRLYDLAIVCICTGRIDEAKAYLEKISHCRNCVMCETGDCFEYYFGMGLTAELEGDKDKARKMYERAVEIKGYYPCARRHLQQL